MEDKESFQFVRVKSHWGFDGIRTGRLGKKSSRPNFRIPESAAYTFPATAVKSNYAVWEKDFEATFHQSLDNYKEIKGKATRFYGTSNKPLAGRFFASTLTSEIPDKICTYVDTLIENIKALEWKSSCLKII